MYAGTLPLCVSVLRQCFGEYILGEGILLWVESLEFLDTRRIGTADFSLPDRLPTDLGVVGLGAFSSGIGVLGRSKVDQQRRSDLGVRGPVFVRKCL